MYCIPSLIAISCCHLLWCCLPCCLLPLCCAAILSLVTISLHPLMKPSPSLSLMPSSVSIYPCFLVLSSLMPPPPHHDLHCHLFPLTLHVISPSYAPLPSLAPPSPPTVSPHHLSCHLQSFSLLSSCTSVSQASTSPFVLHCTLWCNHFSKLSPPIIPAFYCWHLLMPSFHSISTSCLI